MLSASLGVGAQGGLGSPVCEMAGEDNHEKFLYVSGFSNDGSYYGAPDTSPDILAVVDADPASPTYSEIVYRLDMPERGDMLHHFGYNYDKTALLLPGLLSDRIHVIDVAEDPCRPSIKHVNERIREDSGYATLHTVWGLEDGTYLAGFTRSGEDRRGFGGLAVLDAEGRFLRHFGPAPDREDRDVRPHFFYDMTLRPDINRMVTTSLASGDWWDADWTRPHHFPGDVKSEIYIWDLEAEEVIQTGLTSPGNAEVRWLRNSDVPRGFTHTLPGQVWLFEYNQDTDGFDFHLVAQVPGASGDVIVSDDDRWMYLPTGFGVTQFDITDPHGPVLVDAVAGIPHNVMMRLSPDGKRLYVTNSGGVGLDRGPFWGHENMHPASNIGPMNYDYGVYLVEVDNVNGGLTLSDDFFVDLMNVDLGGGRTASFGPHMVLFDPGVETLFQGHH